MAVAMSVHSLLLMIEWVETVELPVVGEVLIMVVPEWVVAMDLTMTLFMMSLFWLVPLWMAFLTVFLKGSVNRWLNIVVGAVFTVFNIWHLTEPCAVMAPQKLIIVSTIVATALIVWFAWKWPKKEG
jgi:hypothetical protein